jgi:multidrug efflux pump
MIENIREREKAIFETLPIPKAVIALAVPTMIGQIITIVYNLADTWFIGLTNDPAKVASITICMPAFMVLTAIANLFGIGGASLISRSLGVRNRLRAGNAASFAVFNCAGIAALYAIVLLIFRRPILSFLGSTESDVSYSYTYLFWTVIVGAVPTVMNSLFGHLVRSEGASRQAGFGISLGGILNILLDPLFMFYLLPEGNEVAGAAIATMISNVIASVYFILFIRKRRETSVITFRPTVESYRNGIPGEVISVGIPAALMNCLALLSNITVNNLISVYRSQAILAGMGIAKKINMLVFQMTQGIAQGVLPLIGYNYAARNFRRMKLSIVTVFGAAFIFSVCSMILAFLYPNVFISSFIKDHETVMYGVRFIKILSLGVPFTAISYTGVTVFQAIGKKFPATLVAVLRKGVVDIPMMFFLSKILPLDGIAWATPLADFTASLVTIILFLITFRKIWQQ